MTPETYWPGRIPPAGVRRDINAPRTTKGIIRAASSPRMIWPTPKITSPVPRSRYVTGWSGVGAIGAGMARGLGEVGGADPSTGSAQSGGSWFSTEPSRVEWVILAGRGKVATPQRHGPSWPTKGLYFCADWEAAGFFSPNICN